MNPLLDELGRYSALGSTDSPPDVTFARIYDRLRCEELTLCTTTRTKGIGTESALGFAALSRLDHPLLTRVRDFGLTDDAVFYSREVGFPTTLKALSMDGIDEGWVFSCLVGVAEALAALHEAGLVHGLVLPEHLHVSTAGSAFSGVRLADAGLRRLLSPTSLQARAHYDSPEVRAGAEITPASDVYQLGVTLIEALQRWDPALVPARTGSKDPPTRPGVSRSLLDLLSGLVAPDPRKRFANGQELRRAVQEAEWALPERSEAVQALVTPQMVGRDHELGRFAAILERASTGDVHAVEFVGRAGMGRSRILRECGERAERTGWTAIRVSPQERAAAIEAAVTKPSGNTLLLVDNADQLAPEQITALRLLATEAGSKPLLIASAGEKAAGFPGAERIVLKPLGGRDLKRFIEPLLLRALNPAELLSAIEGSAAGSPLWVQLLLASWLESGRLRLVNGRPFFDARVDAEVPQTVAETISRIVAGLSPGERDLVEAMAVWSGPVPVVVVEKVLPGRSEVPSALVGREERSYLFIGDTIGPVIRAGMPAEQVRQWSTAFLGVATKDELGQGQRAALLLGAGRSSEAVQTLVDEAREAEARSAYETAFRHLRSAIEHHPAPAVPGVDRTRLVLDAARLATMVGELRWAREALKTGIAIPDGDADLHLEHIVLQANVLRDLGHFGEAASLYVEARALIRRNPRLHGRTVEVQLDEAANDSQRGEGEKALKTVETIVKSLEREGDSRPLGLALQRLGAIHARLQHTRTAAVALRRCARVAHRLGDHQLAARAYGNLGHLYRLLGRSRRALMALDRAEAELVHCPHDPLAASALLNRAEVLIGEGRMVEAEAALLRAKVLRERSGERARVPAILINLANICRHSGRLAAGATFFRESIALAEEFELPIVHVAHSNLGELFLHQGEYEEAGRLLRLSLADRRPHYRGITLINLGRLYREQRRFREALRFLAEAETLLRDSAPRYRPHAVLETGRVLLEAGDLDGATLQLLQARPEVVDSPELEAEYQLLAGLVAAARGEAPQEAFGAAIEGVRENGDPTLRAETLIAVLERAIPRAEIPEGWISGHLRALEDAAAKTDARPVAIQVRLVRAAFAERFPARAEALDLATRFQRSLEGGGGTLEAALGELMQELPGAAGAAVFMVGVDAAGKPLLSVVPRATESADDRIRPYRLAVREFDRKLFRDALAAAGGNVHEAARQLRLPTSTFRYRAGKLGLLKPAQRDG